MANSGRVYLMALLYSTIIAFTYVFTKSAMRFADPVDTLAARFTLAFVVMLVPAWTRFRQSNEWRKWLPLLPIGLLYPTAFFGLQASGLVYTTSSEAGIYQATSPVFTLMLSALVLRESSTLAQKLAVGCSVLGVVVMMGSGGDWPSGSNVAGIAMLLASSLALSLYSVLARFHRGRFSAFEMSAAMMFVGCVFFDALAVGRHAYEGTMGAMLKPLGHGEFIGAVAYLGLFTSVASSLLSNFLLSKLEAFKMSLFVNLGTLLSILAGVILMGDRLTYWHIAGASLIIVGVLGVQEWRSRFRNESAEAKASE
ncbi:EamA family transporter [Cohnella xylanilytica]|nr:EamA family transporter [Cohnella xylanilytica]